MTLRKVALGMMVACMVLGGATAQAGVLFYDDFETAWAGDYADGWVNAAYRHGEAPLGQMMQQTTFAHGGSYGLQLNALSTPESWMWWAAVEVESLEHAALDAAYNPYVSVWYYDQVSTSGPSAGQVYAVPDWVNLYIDGPDAGTTTGDAGDEDWTDVQFGGRFNNTDQYYYVAAGQSSPGWQTTGVARQDGWHNLMFQLSSVDNQIDFYVDGVWVGESYRTDYTNLGTAIGLYTMFDDPLSAWASAPYTIWDDFQVGSTFVPEPATLTMVGLGLAGLLAHRRFRKQA